MGYYVSLEIADFYIPTDKLDDAYKAVCQLNFNNSLKRGGGWPRPENIPNDTPTEHLWFSWMDTFYHETCKNLAEVLEQLGFETVQNDDGLFIERYDSKSGQEDLFIAALAPFAKAEYADEPYMKWTGEEGETWKIVVTDGKAYVHEVKEIVWSEGKPL